MASSGPKVISLESRRARLRVSREDEAAEEERETLKVAYGLGSYAVDVVRELQYLRDHNSQVVRTAASGILQHIASLAAQQPGDVTPPPCA